MSRIISKVIWNHLEQSLLRISGHLLANRIGIVQSFHAFIVETGLQFGDSH